MKKKRAAKAVIIDTNFLMDVFSSPPSPDGEPVGSAIMKGRCILVYGGRRLSAEYRGNQAAWRAVLLLERGNRAKLVDGTEVDRIERGLSARGAPKLRSDDPHILAVAQVSGSRLLCSQDKALHGDFRNPRLLSNPRGRVYQRAEHAALL